MCWGMVLGCCELLWLRILLEEMGFKQSIWFCIVTIWFINQTSQESIILWERKYVVLDCHFFREKIIEKDVILAYTSELDQIAYFLRRHLRGNHWMIFAQAGLSKYICTSLRGYELSMVLSSGHIFDHSSWGRYASLKIAALRSTT